MENVKWFGNSGFAFTDGSTGQKIYYIDPFQLPRNSKLEKADIVFITHAHHDHLSSQDISTILKDDTVVVATPDSLETLNIKQEKFPVEPNREYSVRNFKFQTVPAYNIKPERLAFHPESNKWVGYIFEVNGKRFYHAGDTDFIPEMKDFGKFNIDVAMLPMGGHYTMDVSEMIEAARAIGAKTIIPMHYKMQLGSEDKIRAAEEKLKAALPNALILSEFK